MLFVLDTSPRHEHGDEDDFSRCGFAETVAFVDEPLVDYQPYNFGLVRGSSSSTSSFSCSIRVSLLATISALVFSTPFSAHQNSNQFSDLEKLTLHICHCQHHVVLSFPSRSPSDLLLSSSDSPTDFAAWSLESSQREKCTGFCGSRSPSCLRRLLGGLHIALLRPRLRLGALDVHDNLQLVITSCESHLTKFATVLLLVRSGHPRSPLPGPSRLTAPNWSVDTQESTLADRTFLLPLRSRTDDRSPAGLTTLS